MIYFRGEPLARQTIDMVVDQRVVVEAKSTERLPPDAHRQLFGYLCASTLEVGLPLHFGKKGQVLPSHSREPIQAFRAVSPLGKV